MVCIADVIKVSIVIAEATESDSVETTLDPAYEELDAESLVIVSDVEVLTSVTHVCGIVLLETVAVCVGLSGQMQVQNAQRSRSGALVRAGISDAGIIVVAIAIAIDLTGVGSVVVVYLAPPTRAPAF